MRLILGSILSMHRTMLYERAQTQPPRRLSSTRLERRQARPPLPPFSKELHERILRTREEQFRRKLVERGEAPRRVARLRAPIA